MLLGLRNSLDVLTAELVANVRQTCPNRPLLILAQYYERFNNPREIVVAEYGRGV